MGAWDAPNAALGAWDAPNAALGAWDAPNAALGRNRAQPGGGGVTAVRRAGRPRAWGRLPASRRLLRACR
ncbi:hypothetical protein DMP23_32380 [Amycolatopsis sp. A1MSW2902]